MDQQKIRVYSKLSQQQVVSEDILYSPSPVIVRTDRNQDQQFGLHRKIPALFFICLVCCVFILSCHNAPKPGDKKIISDPLKMDEATSESIQQVLAFALQHNGAISDSDHLKLLSPINDFYNQNNYTNVWSHNEKWEPLADSLLNFIQGGEL